MAGVSPVSRAVKRKGLQPHDAKASAGSFPSGGEGQQPGNGSDIDVDRAGSSGNRGAEESPTGQSAGKATGDGVDHRTVFVRNLSFKSTEKDVRAMDVMAVSLTGSVI